jgi:predicted metalloprotease with PDZ domain
MVAVFCPAAGVHYRVEPADLHAHLFRVTLTIARPAATCKQLSLPVWIPGSYLVREFSKNLQGLNARQGTRRATGAASWTNAPLAGGRQSRSAAPLTVQYEVYAFDNSVRTAWLDSAARLFQRHQPVPACARPQDQPLRIRWKSPLLPPR